VAETWFTTVAAIRAGEPDWQAIAAYRRPILSLLGRIAPGLPAGEREDVAQEVLTVLRTKAIERYAPEKGRFRDCLCTVVRNAVARHRREPAQRVRARGGDDDVAQPESICENGVDDLWEANFENAMLASLLDVVRQEVAPETYQAFELLALRELSGAEVARITGLSRNAVYLARKRVWQRLEQLGARYRDDGQLDDRVRQALESYPDAKIERSLTHSVAATMRSR